MYPVLNSTHVLDFLDTSSMGVTSFISLLSCLFYAFSLLPHVYNEHERVDFFVLGLLDKSNDVIRINPSLKP